MKFQKRSKHRSSRRPAPSVQRFPPDSERKNLSERLLGLTRQERYVPQTPKELRSALGIDPKQSREFDRALAGLERDGQIIRSKQGRVLPAKEADLVPGRIRMTRQGRGFVQPDDPNLDEIAVPESACGTAMHEDRVLVRREMGQGSAAGTGTVIRILERRRGHLVGTLGRSRQFYYVVPDDPRFPHDVYVTEPRDLGRPVQIGDKVVVELKEWLSRHTNPEGEIIELLGRPDQEGVDMLCVLRQYELPLSFPKNVLQQARSNGTTVQSQHLKGRIDCRSHLVITIDPDDAKDFDDAICVQRQSSGDWKLWVHIADVSHYVETGTALDIEARKRGNSTYLVDRVIPMLPEALSNELCSLKPNVDRLTKCVECLLWSDGRVKHTKVYSSVIHSKQRFTYREAYSVLQREPGNEIERMLHNAHHLAQHIRKARFRAGSLALDFPEIKIRLDAHGKVERLERVENDESHQLIEEFMLLANEVVAGTLMRTRVPSVYRVHESPDEQRLEEYREEVLAHRIPCGNLNNRQEVQRLLHHLDQIPSGPALKIGFLRSLMRARYAVEPLGHYGLAKQKYTHFTSPIRRYADLIVHRTLFNQSMAKGSTSGLRQIADHISMTERNSADAERDSRDVKLFTFLEQQLSSDRRVSYDALVTDVRNFGFFVDVQDLGMSGLVPVSGLSDDFYVFDTNRRQLTGRRSRGVFAVGRRVSVRVAKVDRLKKQVDFELAVVGPAQARFSRNRPKLRHSSNRR